MQPEESVLVERAEVARVVPAVPVEHGARRFLVLPVALEDVGASREHLAVVGDLHLDARERRADRAETVEPEAIEGDAGRALGSPVSLDDLDSELAPRLAERGIERGAAGHDVAETAAELTVDAEEDEPPQTHGEPPRDPPEPVEELFLALRLGAPLDRQHERLHDRGGDEHHRDLALLECASNHRGLPARRIDDRRAREEDAEEPAELLEHVREREE